MKDAVATMGAILPDDAGGRDAVHVAVISAVAGQKLHPGQDVGFPSPDQTGERTATTGAATKLGIVDPFIQGAIMPDQRFWLYLYPRTITGLRHQWTHPAFSDDTGTVYGTPAHKLAAEKWIRSFADRQNLTYEEVMSAASNVDDSDYMCIYGSSANGEIPEEFWPMAEIVLGRPIKGRPEYFSCSC